MPDINQTMGKLTGLAALIFAERPDPKILDADACCGISQILEDCAQDLEQIEAEYSSKLVKKRSRVAQLEKFMKDMADQMETDSQWCFNDAADSIREMLKR